jgi:choline kinase
MKKMVDKLEFISGKSGWCTHDIQFMDVMMKDHLKEGDSKVVLINFEFVMQNYQHLISMGVFLQKMFKWLDEESKIYISLRLDYIY